jgi:preprotein translocase subunit SecE
MAIGIYKRGQGKYTRLCTAFGVAIIVGLGCFRLYNKLEAVEWPGLSQRATLWIATMVPSGLFVALGLLIFWLINKASVADFMIAAEGEMKKVSWSSRKEIAVSTVVVIMVVIVMAALLGISDLLFRTFFMWVLGP